MARCRYCSRSGWALRTDGAGLCGVCRARIREEIDAKLEHVRQALAYVRNAADPEVQLSLCDVAIESVERLLPYEERRLAEIRPLPSSLLLMLQSTRDDAAGRIVVEPSPLRRLRAGTLPLHESPGWVAADPAPAVEPRDEAPADRRREPRVPVQCRALLLPHGGRGVLENLSCGGAFLRTDHLEPPGTSLDLVVSAALGPARAEARVCWLRTAAGEMGMGLAFTRPSAELAEYLAFCLARARPAPPQRPVDTERASA